MTKNKGSGVIPSTSLIWFFLIALLIYVCFILIWGVKRHKRIQKVVKQDKMAKLFTMLMLTRRENKVKLENDYVLVSTPSGIHSHKVPSINYVSI